MTDTLSLRAYPRLHFGLVDLSGASQRMYGGLGVSIDGVSVRVESAKAPRFCLDVADLDTEVQLSMDKALANASRLSLPVKGYFSVADRIPSHVGLGSTTATSLALLTSLAIINRWPISPARLRDISSRGRTSAIGSYTFFEGGVVVDVGQRLIDGAAYLPSSRPTDRRPSLRLGRWEMPTNWSVWLLFTEIGPSVSPESEPDFFVESTPTSPNDTLKQIALLYHGILPAILEPDLALLALSLRRFQSCGFKAREIMAQPTLVQDALTQLWNRGLAAGLSSVGPTVFVVTDTTASDPAKLLGHGYSTLGPFSFRNTGFEETHQ